MISFGGEIVADDESNQGRKKIRAAGRGNQTRPNNLEGQGAESPLSSDKERPESGRPDANIQDEAEPVPESEVLKAAERALGYFSRQQKQDGSWRETKSPIAHTSLVVLSYLSYGVTHKDSKIKGSERYTENVSKAIDWLVAQVAPDGELRDGGRMYDQAMGTYALAEACMAADDGSLKVPLQKSVDWLIRNQIRTTGGWRYHPVPNTENGGGDLSVSGWVIAALVSAKNAGVSVPDKVFEQAGGYVVACHSGAGRFGYQSGYSLSMTGAGMFSLQLLGGEIVGPIVADSGFNGEGGSGEKNDNAHYERLVEESAEILLNDNLPDYSQILRMDWPYYYWYYATFAMRMYGGESWLRWKKRTHNILIPMQVPDGSEDSGSWTPNSKKGRETGRIVTTAWIVLTLMAPDRKPVNPRPRNPNEPIGPKPPKPNAPIGPKPPNRSIAPKPSNKPIGPKPPGDSPETVPAPKLGIEGGASGVSNSKSGNHIETISSKSKVFSEGFSF